MKWIGLSIRCEKAAFQNTVFAKQALLPIAVSGENSRFLLPQLYWFWPQDHLEYPVLMSLSSTRDAVTFFHQTSTRVHGYSESLTLATGFESSVDAEMYHVELIRQSLLLPIRRTPWSTRSREE